MGLPNNLLFHFRFHFQAQIGRSEWRNSENKSISKQEYCNREVIFVRKRKETLDQPDGSYEKELRRHDLAYVGIGNTQKGVKQKVNYHRLSVPTPCLSKI